MDYITYLVIAAIIFIVGFMVGWIDHKCAYGEISDEEVFGLSKKGENKMKVIITSSKDNEEKIDFTSLRAALEWAKTNDKTELHLIKIVIKKP